MGLPLLAFYATPALSASALPENFVIEGRLYNSSGAAIAAAVDIKLEVYANGAPTCVLYRELHQNVNVDSTTNNNNDGIFAVKLGDGTSKPGDFATVQLPRIFSNSTSLNGDSNDDNSISADCTRSIANLTSASRYVRVSVKLTTDATYDVLSPDTVISSVPSAMVAESLQGRDATGFAQIQDDASYDLSQSNLLNVFSSVNYPKLVNILSGNQNSQTLSNLGAPSAATDAATKGYTDGNIGGKVADVTTVGPATGNGHTLIWDQTLNRWVTGTPVATDATKLPLAGGTMTGAIDMGSNNLTNIGHMTMASQRTLNLGTYTNAQETALVGALAVADKGKIWFNSDSNIFKVWNGSTAIALDGTVTGAAGGDLTGTYPNPSLADNSVTSAKINTTGGGLGRLLMTDVTTGASVGYISCLIGEVLKWTVTGWACSADSVNTGDITDVTAGSGLSGGGTSGSITLSVNSGTSAGQIVALDGTARLPAVDGSQLTSVNAVAIAGRSVSAVAPSDGHLLTWNNTSSTWGPNIYYKFSGNGFVSTTTFGPNLNPGTTAALPAYTFLGDPDTGMYRASADNLAFSTGATERMRIDASGRLAIGTSTANQLLTVEGPMSLRSQVAPTSTANYGKIYVDSGDSNKLKYMNPIGMVTDLMGDANFISDGNTFGSAATLGTNDNFALNFETNNTTAMTILPNANVGIGTTSPGYALVVGASAGWSGQIAEFNGTANIKNNSIGSPTTLVLSNFNGGNTGTAMEFRGNNLGVPRNAAKIRADQNAGNGVLAFEVASTNVFQEQMRIDAAGNVGVGTTTPRSRMDVNGVILGKPAVSNGTSTIDFGTGNIQFTTNSCGAFALHNLKDGGNYTFAVKGTTASTCSFSAYSDAGISALTFHLPAGHGSTSASTHTLYTFVVVGSDVYASWSPGI